MKYAINTSFGGFSLPDGFCVKYGMEEYSGIDRTDSRLIDWIVSHDFTENNGLNIVEIPDDSTDYMLLEYDGEESVLYVKNGKMFYAPIVGG